MPPLAFYSHTTAALLHGIPVPWWLEKEATLHVALPSPARAPHASGIRGHRVSVEDIDVVALDGLRLTHPVRTWCDLAEVLAPPDLIAAGDFIIHWRSPLASAFDLLEGLKRRKSRRGVRRALAALPLLNDRSESAPESILRVLLVTAGFSDPLVNHVVSDEFGEFVGRTDLILQEHKLVLEYMGDYHRTTKGQWRADMTRRSRLEAQGWIVMELNGDDLRDPVELISRIRSRIEQR